MKHSSEASTQQQKAANLAKYGDFSGYKAIGYTDAEINNMTKAWQAANAPKPTASGSSGTSSKPTQSTAYKDVLAYVKKNPDNAEAYLNSMVDNGLIDPDEALYILQVVLGGNSTPPTYNATNPQNLTDFWRENREQR